MIDCKFRDDKGRCTKYGRHPFKCGPFTVDSFSDKLNIIDMDEACKRGSIFGNSFFFITEEQIEKLRNGKVLFAIDEYGTFIALKKEKGNDKT